MLKWFFIALSIIATLALAVAIVLWWRSIFDFFNSNGIIIQSLGALVAIFVALLTLFATVWGIRVMLRSAQSAKISPEARTQVRQPVFEFTGREAELDELSPMLRRL